MIGSSTRQATVFTEDATVEFNEAVEDLIEEKFEQESPEGFFQKLIVVVPALGGNTAQWSRLMGRLLSENDLCDSRVLFFDHHKGALSRARARDVAFDLAKKIDSTYSSNDGFKEVILVGHSFGALLVREAYIRSLEIYDDDKNQPTWANKVSRIILFSGLPRGWQVNKAPNLKKILAILRFFKFLPLPLPIAHDLTRGSQFVNNLSVRWLRHLHELNQDSERELPMIFHLVGSEDAIYDRRDDEIEFPDAYTLRKVIEYAHHSDVFRLVSAPNPRQRYNKILETFTISREQFRGQIESLDNKSPIKKFILMLHGIRDEDRVWMDAFEDKFFNPHPSHKDFEPPTNVDLVPVLYDSFRILKFLIPELRREPVPIFENTYIRLLSQYPGAEFSFIGHSHGTYVLGQSLKRLNKMHFERIYLAGSVLPATFDWQSCFSRNQVGDAVRNDCANRDRPVALLASALSLVPFLGVGIAGFTGFRGESNQSLIKSKDEKITQLMYLTGGHSAALKSEKNIFSVRDFILNGTRVRASDSNNNKPSWLLQMISRAMPFLGVAIIFLVIYGDYQLFEWASSEDTRLSWSTFLGANFGLFLILKAF